jgi:hypothetical protein
MEAGSRPAQHGVKIMKRLIVGLLATTATASLLYAWPRSASEVHAAQPAVTAAPVVKAEAKDAPASLAKVEAKEEPAIRVIESARDGCGAWPYYKRNCLTAAKPAIEASLPPAPAATVVATAKPAEPVAPGIPAGLASQVGLTAEPVPTLPIAAAAMPVASPSPAATAAPVDVAKAGAGAPAAAPKSTVEAPAAELQGAARAPQLAARAPITVVQGPATEAPPADVAIQTPRVTTQPAASIPAAPAFTPRVQRPVVTQALAPRVAVAAPAAPAAKVATRATPVETAASRPAVRKAVEAEERPMVRRAFKVRPAYAEYVPVVDRDHHGQYRPGQAHCDRLAGRGRH